jgi:hypothetical protein
VKSLFWKLQPYLAGGLIGWLAFWPPPFTESWGWWRYLVMGSLAGLAFLASILLAVLQSLPQDLALEPLGRPLHDPGIQTLAESLHLLGFRQASEPLLVGTKPPAALVAFLHREQPAWATVFRTGTLPAKVSFDIVSILEGGNGGLTTLNNPAGAVLPAAPGSLRQVFPGAAPERVFAEHCAALAGLGKRGLAFRRPAAAAFPDLFRKSSARQRAAFLRSPLRHTLAILWRLWTKDNPHLGPVLGQRAAELQIRHLLARRA